MRLTRLDLGLSVLCVSCPRPLVVSLPSPILCSQENFWKQPLAILFSCRTTRSVHAIYPLNIFYILHKCYICIVPLLLVRNKNLCLMSYVYPWHFGTDRDPWIRISYLRIRLRIRIQILRFSSVTVKMATKKLFFFKVFLFITYLLKLHLHHFSKRKRSKRSHKTLFLLDASMIRSQIRIRTLYLVIWFRIRKAQKHTAPKH
jgi:hypothetical protein